MFGYADPRQPVFPVCAAGADFRHYPPGPDLIPKGVYIIQFSGNGMIPVMPFQLFAGLSFSATSPICSAVSSQPLEKSISTMQPS